MVTMVITSLESLVKGYIHDCKAEGKSPKTIAIYETVLKNFIWYYRTNDYPEAPQLTAMHIRHFLLYLSTETNRWGINNPATRKPANQTTVNDYHRALRCFFNWLEREGIILENPFTRLRAPKIEEKDITALTPSEIERLFSLCSRETALQVRNKAILSILIDCGLTISELVSINLDDIDLETHSVLIRQRKGRKRRRVIMGSRTQEALRRYATNYRKSENDRVFINRNGVPLDAGGVKILIKRLGQEAKVNVHPQKLKDTFALNLLSNCGDAIYLKNQLGHSTMKRTLRYLRILGLDTTDNANDHRECSPLDNLCKKLHS
jgi:site-specific recombinase XerD